LLAYIGGYCSDGESLVAVLQSLTEIPQVSRMGKKQKITVVF